MGHSLEQLGTATLDTMGGLVTNCNPQDLPEGASPRCWDVDFIIGSVFTRAGLQSVYTYTNVLQITSLTVGSAGSGVFTYTGPTPSVNEGFLLSNFIGTTFALNGQTVFVLSVNPIAGTFTAQVTLNTGTYTLLAGTATSIVGDFLGPNVPTTAVSAGTGNVWQNPQAIMGTTGYASVASGSTTTSVQIPENAGSLPVGGQALWNNPLNILTTGSSFATITMTAGQTQDAVVCYSGTLAIPSNAVVTGVQVNLKGKTTVAGTGSVNVQLTDGTTLVPYGTIVNIPLATSLLPFSAGSSSYQWGTTITPTQMNGQHLGVMISAAVSSGTNTISVNSVSITVTYELSGTTGTLVATGFVFSVPASAGLTGFGLSFQAYTTVSSSLIFQLLKNGLPIGQPITQPLTTAATVYEIGGASDLWGAVWSYADVNNASFGVQITATGEGTSSLNDVDMLAYISPSLVNFNYVKSYIQDDNQTYTLALDASGILWREDVTNRPGNLSTVLSGIIPGAFAQSSTFNNREHICFSNLSIGTDRPRVYDGTSFYPLSQCGPGAPPTITTSASSTATPLAVTAYSVSADVVTFTFTVQAPPFTPVVGSLYKIAGTGNVNLDGFTFSVLGTPAPTDTSFAAATTTATGSAGGLTATASPTNFYPIQSITQDSTLMPPLQSTGDPSYYPGEAQSFYGQVALWSSGPGQTTPGFTFTLYYGQNGAIENSGLLNSFKKGYAVYVYIQGSPLGNGTQQVTSHGTGTPPGESGTVPYFTVTTTTSSYQRYTNTATDGTRNGPGNTGTFQLTIATLTTATPITNLTAGAQVQIEGASPAAWNNTWTVEDTLLSGSYNITESQMLAGGVAQFTYSSSSAFGQATVTNGQVIELSDLTNVAAFNTTGVVSAATGSTFQIAGFSGSIPAQPNPVPENGQGVTFGTEFLFDDGLTYLGTATPSSIFGDTTTQPGTIGVIGGSIIPIGAGIRQGVVYFITENEYETTPSAPFTFTTPEDTNQVICSNIPLGPPDTIARALAFTEAGQNGVPGQNFYVIEQPVTTTVNGVVTTVGATIINDNVTTQQAFSFTDAVLLNSTEIDIQGNDLFNLIELGSCGWCVPYAGRMFYGLQLNKIDNWTTGGGLTFDAGYLPSTSGLVQPLGWSYTNTVDQTLLTSPVTGQALYIKSTYNTITAQLGMIYQTAYQDPLLVPIIQPNTAYSVRVACDAPSGLTTGTLTIDLTDYSSIGFGTTYGSFTVPLASMTTNMQVFVGTLLTRPFTTGVSANLQIRVYIANAGPGVDCLVDRIEVYPTNTPYLAAQVYGSYTGQSEAIDGSSTGGIIDTTTENAQAVMGAFVMHDLMFLLKTSSWYSTQDNPNSEPGGWGLHEVSNKVGTIGINSYDTGEEWCITACRSGIYGFDGGQPTKISQELWNLWEQINWNAGNTIVLRNDVVSKRLYVAIPLPTGVNPATGIPANKYTNVWLPNAPYNPTPTTPNVMLMLNYQGLADIKEMMMSPEVHTTINKIVLPIAQAWSRIERIQGNTRKGQS